MKLNMLVEWRPTNEYVLARIAETKRRLMALATDKAPRPLRSSKDADKRFLAHALARYTNKSHISYDFSFDTKIRILRPDWFDPDKLKRGAKHREELLELAKSGAPRPQKNSKDPHERKLAIYMTNGGLDLKSKTRQGVVELLKELYRIRPDWFDYERNDRVVENQNRLLELAKSGAPRPQKNSKDPHERKLAVALSIYTLKKYAIYAEFDTKIRILRPDWFDPDKLKRVIETKNKLLKMAKRGDRRPSSWSDDPDEKRLGISLTNYTSKSATSYDIEFDSKIHSIRPNWFKRLPPSSA